MQADRDMIDNLIKRRGSCRLPLGSCRICIIKNLFNTCMVDTSYAIACKIRDNNYVVDDFFIFDNKEW